MSNVRGGRRQACVNPAQASIPSSSQDASQSGLVTPVIRGLRLLEYIARGGNTDNLSEVGRLIDVNRLTVMRLLATLEHEGVIERLPAGGYQLGLRYLTLAATGLAGHDLIAAGRRVIRQLCQKAGHAVYLSLLDGADMTYVLREMPPAGLVSLITIGSRVAAWRAAPGRAMLAALPLEQLQRRPDMQALSATEASAYTQLLADLEQIRQQGVAWSHSALEQGISACAVAVTDALGRPVAAISVAGASHLLADTQVARALQDQIKTAGQQLSALALELDG